MPCVSLVALALAVHSFLCRRRRPGDANMRFASTLAHVLSGPGTGRGCDVRVDVHQIASTVLLRAASMLPHRCT